TTLSFLSYSQALELLALPESEREKFIEGHDMESLTTREFRALIQEEKQKMQLELERAEQYLEETQDELELKEEELAEAPPELAFSD
ncbi:MAG: DUF3102 domain-containing protein, partial [Syntrophomonadaceae bacterium]|nr:DUF3102 domain-containing protein [Syntrophomonadaceae bacterium]